MYSEWGPVVLFEFFIYIFFFPSGVCGVISFAEAKQYFAIQRQTKKKRQRECFCCKYHIIIGVWNSAYNSNHFMVCVRVRGVSMDVIDGKVVCDLCRLHCLQAWNFHKTDDDDDNDYNNDGFEVKNRILIHSHRAKIYAGMTF